MLPLRGDDGSAWGTPSQNAVALVYGLAVLATSVGLLLSLLHVTGEGCGELGGSTAAAVRAAVALACAVGQLGTWIAMRRRPSGALTAALAVFGAVFWLLAFWTFLVANCR